MSIGPKRKIIKILGLLFFSFVIVYKNFKKIKKQNFNVKPFFAIIISFRGIVSVVCVQRPFPAAFPQQVSSIFIMNSLLINCRLFKINSYNLTECWCLSVLSPRALGREVP